MKSLLKSSIVAALLFCVTNRAVAQTNFATLVSDGAWTWFNDPRALFHNGLLYFGYVRSSDGRSALSAFNPATGLTTNVWTSSLTQRDDHNNPGLLLKQDGKMLAIHARHAADQFFSYRLSLTTDPSSSANWGTEQTISPTGATMTYANPFQLTAESGKIYNFCRNLNFNPTVFTSTNGGAAWSAPQLLIKTGTGNIRPYIKYCSDQTNRIDFLYTDGHPRNVTNSLYHAYYQAGSLRKTDGSLLKTFSDIPLLHDSGERGSIIYQYSDADSADPHDHIPTGRAWCWEIVYQTNGRPACVFSVQRDNVTGTNWFDDRIYYYYARWTGTNWQKRFIAHAGRPLYSAEDDYAGGICMDPENPNIVYLSSNATDPFNLSTTNVTLRTNDRYEIFRGVTTNGGMTFLWEAVTTNSTMDNLRPYVPRRHGGSPALIWFRGTYNTYTSYNCAVAGLFSLPVPHPPGASITKPVTGLVTITNLDNQLKLEGVAHVEGAPGALSIEWTTASGPTNAIFSDPASSKTTASFSLPGTYLLRFTASDGMLSSFAELTVRADITNIDSPDAGRAMWLKFNETSATFAADSSGNGNNGTLSGGATWRPTEGMRAGALHFDGESGVVTVPDAATLDNTSAFTLTYWFRADAYPTDSAGLVSKRDSASSNNSYTTYLKADKKIYVDIQSADDRFASATAISTGVWYHVALVFEGSLAAAQRAKLWLNGILDVTAAESTASVANYPSHLRIGSTPSASPTWFNGMVDDVRFYRRALSTNEIMALAVSNIAPSIAIGPAPAATNGVAATLNATATDDGLGGPLTAWWSQVSGPGKVSFADSNSPVTTVTFNQAGAYTLRLSASDTQVELCDDLAVNVGPNPNIYEDWIAQSFPGVTNPAVIGIAADPDNDDVKNLVEFAFGMTPSVPDAVHFALGQPGLPIGLIMNFGGTSYLAMLAQRPIGRSGIAYGAEVSGDFDDWNDALEAGPPSNNANGTEIVTFRDVVPVDQATLRLMRLKVTKP